MEEGKACEELGFIRYSTDLAARFGQAFGHGPNALPKRCNLLRSKAATLKPAQFLGLSDQLGTIAPRKLADLVLLEANPLDDIHNSQKIRAVVFAGPLFGSRCS